MRQLLLCSVLVLNSLVANDDASCQERPKSPGNVQVNKDPFSMNFPTADAKAAVLINVFRDPEESAESNERRLQARKILVSMGKFAVPRILEGVRDKDYDVSSRCADVLSNIGAVAVPDVRACWPKLTDHQLWLLMEFMGRHDYGRGADYALNCLKSTDERLRLKAWGFLIRHKEKRVKEEFFRNLEGTCEFPPCYEVIRGEPIFDAKREEELLIALLDKDSWAAQDRGFPKRPKSARFMPNDERSLVVLALKARNAKKAASALLPVLQAQGPGRGYMGQLIIPIMGDFGCKEAIPELKQILLIDKKLMRWGWPGAGIAGIGADSVKLLAARALWQLGDEQGRQFVLALEDSKAFAAKSVALCGDKRDIPLLASWLDDPTEDVVKSACEGLARITGVNIHAGKKPVLKNARADALLWKEWYKKERNEKQ